MDLSNLQRGWKKAKKHWEVGIELSKMTILKALKYTPCLSLWACQEKIMDFTDLIHIIYWPAKIAQKEANTFK